MGNETKKCPHCGQDVQNIATVCQNCGHNFLAVVRTEQPTKKKKHGCLISILVVFGFFFLVSVFGDSEEEKKDSGTSKQIEESSGIKEEKEKKQDDVTKKGNGETNKDRENKGKTEKSKDKKTAFKKKSLYKGHKCNIEIVSGNDDGVFLKIKNNSKKDYSFDIHSMAINGIMTNCNIYTASMDVPSKKKGIMNVDFDSEWVKDIEHVEYIDCVIWVYDNAKSYKDFDTGLIRIKSNQFKKERKIRQRNDCVRSNGLIIQKEKLDTDTFEFSVINKNKKYIEFDFENSSINGWSFDSDYLFDAKGVYVYPNSISTIKIDLSDFSETNKIKKIKNIEFSLAVREEGSYFREKNTKKIKFK